MNETDEYDFLSEVAKLLSTDDQAHELWVPIADAYRRGGPDDVMEYLGAQQLSLEERIKDQLNQIEGT